MEHTSKDQGRQNDPPEPSSTVHRVTVPEAAEILGITTDAVRSRTRRGKLRREEGEHGTAYVLLEAQEDPEGQDGHPTGGNGREMVEDGPLVGELRERVRSLETQLDHERQANRENRQLLAVALERIPEMPAPEPAPVARESRETASEQQGNGEVHPDDRAAEKLAWWRRFFGFE
jgi:hypothetical protein